MNNGYKQMSMKDKITIMEDAYAQMEDSNYKKKQLKVKIDKFKSKYDPKVFWSKGTYRKDVHEGFDDAVKARLEAAHQKDLEEQTKEETA